ncbi:MAG: hypothetical protein RBQ97_03695 [Acholeplasma sp.]|nr:hypothetical protein [Acholeplasma sp.]
MEKALQVLDVALSVLIIATVVSIVLFLIITVLYLPSFLQKAANLKKSEDILKYNIEIVEKATYFETNQEFNKIIDEQMQTIRSNAAKVKSLNAQIEQLERDINNKK